MQQSAVFLWKSKRIFPSKNVLIRSLKKVSVVTLVSQEAWSYKENFMAAKLKKCFVLLRVTLLAYKIA